MNSEHRGSFGEHTISAVHVEDKWDGEVVVVRCQE